MPNKSQMLLVLAAALVPLAWGGSSSSILRPRQQGTQDMPRPTFGPVPWGEQLGRDDFPCARAGQIAFTFEDGPSPYTPSILNTLSQYNIIASFFMTGSFEDGGLAQPRYHGLARFMYNQGHLLGSHSYSHDDLRSFTEEEVRADLLELEATFADVLGVVPTYFRAPFTECDVGDCLVNIRPLVYHIVDYNIDSFDSYELADPADLVAFFRETMENADPAVASYIVRFHDTEEVTANGLLEEFILIAATRGFEFVTVGECLGDDPGNFYRNPQTGNALGNGNEPPPSPDPSSSTESTAVSASTSVSSSSVDLTSSAIETTGTPEITGNPDSMVSDTQTSTATDQEVTITLDTLTQETPSVASTTIDTAGSDDPTITETQTITQTETDTADFPGATTTPAVAGTSDMVTTSDSTPTITEISVSSVADVTSSEETTSDASQTALESSLDATSSLVTTELASQTTAAATSEEPSASHSLITMSIISETTSTGFDTPSSSVVDGQTTSGAPSDDGITTSTSTAPTSEVPTSEVTDTGFCTSTASFAGSLVPSDTVSDISTPTATITTTCSTATCTTAATTSADETAPSVTSTDSGSQSSPATNFPHSIITVVTKTLDSTTQDAQTNSQNTPSPSSSISPSDVTPLPLSSSTEIRDSSTIEEDTSSATAMPNSASYTTFPHQFSSAEVQSTGAASTTINDQDTNETANPATHTHYGSSTTITHTAGATDCPTATAANDDAQQSPPTPTETPQNGGGPGQETSSRCGGCQDGVVGGEGSFGNWLTVTRSSAIGRDDLQSAGTSAGGISAGVGIQTYVISSAQPPSASVAGQGAGELPSGAETGGVGGSSAVPTRVVGAGGFAVGASGCAAVFAAVMAWMVL
ncbi:hypothetical protein MCOR25_003870 [Pyricularia grisea]|nr:hypothetical protein MCOR25_003870 [Pyricularia grisea]